MGHTNGPATSGAFVNDDEMSDTCTDLQHMLTIFFILVPYDNKQKKSNSTEF